MQEDVKWENLFFRVFYRKGFVINFIEEKPKSMLTKRTNCLEKCFWGFIWKQSFDSVMSFPSNAICPK